MFLFRKGRCTTGFPNPIHQIYLTTTDYVYGEIYLNAKGKILSNGDLSYQRQQENILCSSSSFLKYIKTTLRTECPIRKIEIKLEATTFPSTPHLLKHKSLHIFHTNIREMIYYM